MQKRRNFLIGATALSAAAFMGIAGRAGAQGYPAGSVRIIVPYPPGGATDVIGRLVGQQLQAALGAPFIIENRGGGGTQIGTKAIAEAIPDGQTLGFIDSAFVINPGLVATLPYDTARDFAPLSLSATAQLVLNVHNSVPATTLAEFIALARAQPGKYNFGSAGVGSAPHLAGEQFRQAAGLNVNHVPYRGGSTVFNDLIAGHIHFAFTTVPSMIEHIRAGTVRGLAVCGATRSPLLPNAPHMSEAGLPTVDAAPLFGLIAPSRVPKPILDRVSDIASAAVRSGPLHARLAEMGYMPVGSSAAEFKTRIEAEIAKWTRIIKAANIKPNA